jgi:hypothetical protein
MRYFGVELIRQKFTDLSTTEVRNIAARPYLVCSPKLVNQPYHYCYSAGFKVGLFIFGNRKNNLRVKNTAGLSC